MHIGKVKLKEAPFSKDLGEKGFMWILKWSETTKDFKTQEKCFTNYKAVIFAKTPGQINFYQSALVAGSVICLASEKLKIDLYFPDNGGDVRPTLEMDNAKVTDVFKSDSAPAPQQQQQGGYGHQQAPQQGYAPKPQQQAPQQGYAPKPQQRPAQQSPQQPAPQQQAPQQQGPQQQGYAPQQTAILNDDIPF